MLSPDYAKFRIERGTIIPSERMNKKIEAIPFPDMEGKTVLDIGCDYAQFSFLCANWGAKVTGLDRNRDVKGLGFVDVVRLNNQNAKDHGFDCSFHELNLGKQWGEFGKHDIILCMSMYHHVYENCGDHKPIWLWLWRHCKEMVIWENPTDNQDRVVGMNVSRGGYNTKEILDAASIYFDYEYKGHALHEPHRHVYFFYPKKGLMDTYAITPRNGMGGASKAFIHGEGRRMCEIERILGYRPHPGTLNVTATKEFNWEYHYYTGGILEIRDRMAGLCGEWQERETRFYPCAINGVKCHVFRMRGEKYPQNFMEIISEHRLRDMDKIEELIVCG